ncbi:lecithin retinol acyltransferase family protein [Paraburkholderia sp. MM5384-R2]|uniref:lecithin retinol acyltransferase family protein n=1 Tax=Paraburkholderia sp. MM5384-R2 TaxID=2723097 RepID=UPI00160AAF2F|nr:lecithin retinol acyltransferase family protein [Paraburkholderia sp. MM5384-R2]MBB5502222.1 cell wall-associated NlpC family hydrolase [Paraburkholderia sp. MM5384-R2]
METPSIDWLVVSRKSTSTECTIAVGDHLVSERDGYTHHGIYAGNGKVIHYGGFHRCAKRRPIEYISLHGFAAGKGLKVQHEPDAIYTGLDAVQRARSRLGEDRYQLLTNNCEHFCTWCLLGVGRSEQVRQCLRNPWTGIKTLFSLAKAECIPSVTARSRLAGTVAV